MFTNNFPLRLPPPFPNPFPRYHQRLCDTVYATRYKHSMTEPVCPDTHIIVFLLELIIIHN